ncbi:MAG: PEP/pyruvate-binding domain-containing protein [Pseudomonadota bacterium]
MIPYKSEYATDRFYFDEPPYDTLMQNRITEILLVCSNYERFVLEEDGRIEEQLFQEYLSLGLGYPPRFTVASTANEAFGLLERKDFDMVITMLETGDSDPSGFGKRIKQLHPGKPIVVLTRFSQGGPSEIERNGSSPIKYVFNWLGNADLLLAIVKLIEDQINAEHDINAVGVQVVILVENSIRYYSSYLPIIYRILFEQARSLMREGLNEHQQTIRMRGRPKIMLATNYEMALDLYKRYRSNVLGVISDISYEREGEIDPEAGLTLCKHIRGKDPEVPILLQSAHEEHAKSATACNVGFICKKSKNLLNELTAYIKLNFGFGNFVFRMPGTLQHIAEAMDLVDFQQKIQNIPAESLEYHAENHHFSKWLKARSLYSLANVIKPKGPKDFESIESLRQYLLDTIKNYRMHMGRGVVADFDKSKVDESAVFQRIGKGSLGGKARGITFINTFLKRRRIMFKYPNVAIQIPRTVVLCTNVFENFMEKNDLYSIALSDLEDEEILKYFLRAQFAEEIQDDLRSLVKAFGKPLAVRSSSLLEDSRSLPFAGVYSTYFVPNNSENIGTRLRELSAAIKGVYASTYCRSSKNYASATENRIDEERMAVIIQEVTGNKYGNMYYPNVSGVARSLNFYPVDCEKPEEGVVNVALGLGKTVVDGRKSLRFCPAHPQKIFQLSTTKIALESSQQKFYALNLAKDSFQVTTDEALNLLYVDVKEAAEHKANMQLLSTFDFENNTIRDDANCHGRKIVTFASILKHEAFPLAEIVQTLLEIGKKEMNMPVEIEFAVNLDVPEDVPASFKFLQIRPIVEGKESDLISVRDVLANETIITATKALGNGLYPDLFDIVYVKPTAFDPKNSEKIIGQIEEVNNLLRNQDRKYILIGPGRWGTTDPWLGISVKWHHITHAKAIVETALEGLQVDPSQGSHFFHNLTAFNVVYLAVDPMAEGDTFDVGYLDSQPAFQESEFLRHLRFSTPIVMKIDGRQSSGQIKAVIFKPREVT